MHEFVSRRCCCCCCSCCSCLLRLLFQSISEKFGGAKRYPQNILYPKHHSCQKALASTKTTKHQTNQYKTSKQNNQKTATPFHSHPQDFCNPYIRFIYVFSGSKLRSPKKTLSSFSDFFVFSHELLFCKNWSWCGSKAQPRSAHVHPLRWISR